MALIPRFQLSTFEFVLLLFIMHKLLFMMIQDVDALPLCLQQSPKYQQTYIKPILSQLENKGYTIHPGWLYWVTNETCHGGSPASSYGMWHFPNISSNLKPSPNTGANAILFHPSDAILFTGCTAPRATYLGFENYVYAKYNPENAPNTSMSIVFGSTGGAINHYLINTTNVNGSTSAPFDSMTTIITSGDKVTYNDIYNEYRKQNLTKQVNDHWIPQQYFKFTPYNFTRNNYTVMSYPGQIDSFMPVTRIINHLDQQDWVEYVNYKQPVYWITAEKIRKPNDTQPRIPYTELYVRNHTSTHDEFDLQDAFDTYVNETITYFESYYAMDFVESRTVVNYNIPPHYYGYNCYENNINCQGDLRDEQYWGTHNGTNVVRRHPTFHPKGAYNLMNDSYFLMMGINHVATNMTLYDNVILYYMEDRLVGLYEPIFMVDNYHYNNSCNQFNVSSKISPETLSKFYMVQISRPYNCRNKNLPSICPEENIIKESNLFAMYTRNLLNLETMTRPSQQQVIPDILLHFRTNKEQGGRRMI